MNNVETKMDKNGILTITVDTNKTSGPSKSGKTITIASTQGNKECENGIFVGLNVYRYPRSK